VEEKENRILESGVRMYQVLLISTRKQIFSYLVLLLLFFYLFAEPVTAMLVLYALHLSEIASDLTLLPYFELLN